jgi:hypothetical protein
LLPLRVAAMTRMAFPWGRARFTPKAGIRQLGWHVRFGSEADIRTATSHVRFTPNSDIDCVFRHVCFGPKADIPANSLGARELSAEEGSHARGGYHIE